MKNIRIIARLDIKGPDLVKGIHLEGLRVLGSPGAFARFYYEQGADELMYQDVVASLYERNSLHSIISETAKEIFIPLTVGGGIRSLDDIRKVLRAGADKVCINTAAIKNPQIIRQASEAFGSSTIVAAIEAVKQPDGTYIACSDNGREESNYEVTSWAQQLAELGAGELLITSVDREGTGEGYDTALVRSIADLVSIPVIAHGGAGNKEHVVRAIREGRADAVAIAGMFHYAALRDSAIAADAIPEGNFEFVRKGILTKTFKDAVSIPELKKYIKAENINCRI